MTPEPVAPPPRIAIALTERAATGARLVAVDEHGDRQFPLVAPDTGIARDTNPTISPDGKWIAFASSRARKLDETSLWIAPVEPDAVAHRLTDGASIDAHPTWTPDGAALVYASTRGGGFDLWRLPIDRDGRAAGEPVQLTSGPGHEVTPSVAPDGTIAYAAVAPNADGSVESHLEARAPDGAIARITDGPADASPALSPDGQTLAFVRPAASGEGANAELWIMAWPHGTPELLVDLPPTDEGGPVWSRDGRFVFATSVLREGRKPVFSSVIVVDLQAQPRKARMLRDRVGAIARLTPAIVAPRLDAAALDADPDYLAELARIIAAAIGSS